MSWFGDGLLLQNLLSIPFTVYWKVLENNKEITMF